MEVPDGSQVTLTASITGTAQETTYAWTPPVGASVSDSGTATLSWTFDSATDEGTYTVTATDATAVDSPKTASVALTAGQNAGDIWVSPVTTPLATTDIDFPNASSCAIGATGRIVTAWQFYPNGGNGTDVPVIQCFNPQGDVLWSRRIGIDALSISNIMCAIDNDNNCYIVVGASNNGYVWAFGPTGTLLWDRKFSSARFSFWHAIYFDPVDNRLVIHGRDANNATKWIFSSLNPADGSLAFSRELTVPGATSNGVTSVGMTRNDAGNYIVVADVVSFADGAGSLLFETDTSFTSIVRQTRLPFGFSNDGGQIGGIITDASNNVYLFNDNGRIVQLSPTFTHLKTILYTGYVVNMRRVARDLDGSIWAVYAGDPTLVLGAYSIGVFRFNADCSQILQQYVSVTSQLKSHVAHASASQWANFELGRHVRTNGTYNGSGTRGEHVVVCENFPQPAATTQRMFSANGITPADYLARVETSTPLIEALDFPTTLISFNTATLGASGITVASTGINVVEGAGQFDRKRHTLQDNTNFLLHCNSAGAGNGGVPVEDSSGQRVTITRNSTGADPGTCFISADQSVFGGYSLRLNGTDSDAGHLSVSDIAFNPSYTTPYTIEWMARHDTVASTQCYFGTSNRTGGIMLLDATTLRVSLNGNNYSYTIPAVSTDTWYAFSLTHTGLSPWTCYLHINGIYIGSQNINTNFDFSTGFIGRMAVSGATAYPMKGYMDEIRMSWGVSRYTTSNYTVATNPFVGFGD